MFNNPNESPSEHATEAALKEIHAAFNRLSNTKTDKQREEAKVAFEHLRKLVG